MDKENSKSASSLRRSLLAERIRIRQEWARLKGTEGATTSANVLKKRTQNKVHKIICRAAVNKEPPKPQPSSDALSGVVALVQVGSETRALALRAALSALGATVVPTWSPLVTHLVWADGGCRSTRAKARALASRLVSPLWVEACAAAGARLPERAFPAAARASDLPSPATLRRLLKIAEMENIPLIDLLSDSKEGSEPKPTRLRISSEHSDSSDASHESTDVEVERRVNTAPRRALPASTSPATAASRTRRKLFTQKEPSGDTDASASEEEEESTRKRGQALTQRCKKDLARAERMAKRLAGAAPAKTRTNPASVAYERPRIVLTGMTRAERHAVAAAVRSLNGKLQAHVTKKTTHILIGSCRDHSDKDCDITGVSNLNISTKDIQEIPKCDRNGRTLNALLGAARGCRVLYAQWALDSCKEKKWLHHVGYEVPHLKKISQKARVERKATRLMRAEYAYDVFNGMRVRVSPEITQRDAALQLLNLCGAVIVNQNGGIAQNGRSCLTQNGRSCLTQYGRTQNGDRTTDHTTSHDIVLGNGENEVNSKWVFDSVAAGRMRTTRKYVNSFYDAIRLATQELCR